MTTTTMPTKTTNNDESSEDENDGENDGENDDEYFNDEDENDVKDENDDGSGGKKIRGCAAASSVASFPRF